MKNILAFGVVALASLSVSSVQADVVYDSSSAYLWNTPSPTATSGFNGNIVVHPTVAFWANQLAEVGGRIGFAGTARLAQSATVQMRTGPNGSPAVAGNVTLTLSFYTINGDGSVGSSIGSRTQTFSAPAGSGSTNMTYRPYYDATFDLSSLGLTLPNQVYFGVALQTPGLDATTQSTNISLWNYGTAPGFPTTDSDYDGSTIAVGTDLSNTYWTRSLGGVVSSYLPGGFTPNLVVNAIPTPGAAALLGVGALAATRRRRSK